MSLSKNVLEEIFELHTEFHVRDQMGFSRDRIFRGIFATTFATIHGYQKHELKIAQSRGWINRVDIDPDGKGNRSAYIWLLEEMPQRGWYRTLLDKIYRLCTGEYSRYYGSD